MLGICQMVRAGSFRPCLSEVAFGRPPKRAGQLGRFELPLPDGRVLSLDGKIDRLDVAQINGRKVALILDYKRSRCGASFQLGRLLSRTRRAAGDLHAGRPACGAGIADEVAGALCMPIETHAGDGHAGGAWPTRRAPQVPVQGRRESSTGRTGSIWIPTRRAAARFTISTSREGQRSVRQVRDQQHPEAGAFRRDCWIGPGQASIRLATDIVSGRIEARPYHRGNERACTLLRVRGRVPFRLADQRLQFPAIRGQDPT